MEYGTSLYPSTNKVHPDNNNIHELIYKYFDNPIMTKMHNNNNESHYYTKINSQLLNKHRYIIAIVPKDTHNQGKRIYLQNLTFDLNYFISFFDLNSILKFTIFLYNTN